MTGFAEIKGQKSRFVFICFNALELLLVTGDRQAAPLSNWVSFLSPGFQCGSWGDFGVFPLFLFFIKKKKETTSRCALQ